MADTPLLSGGVVAHSAPIGALRSRIVARLSSWFQRWSLIQPQQELYSTSRSAESLFECRIFRIPNTAFEKECSARRLLKRAECRPAILHSKQVHLKIG